MIREILTNINEQTSGPYAYRVRATGLGSGYNRYPLDFEMTSNYDIETDRESVMDRVRDEINHKGFRSYTITSVEKVR